MSESKKFKALKVLDDDPEVDTHATRSEKRSRKKSRTPSPSPSEASDDESDYSCESDISSQRRPLPPPKQSWTDWMWNHRLILGLVVCVIIVVCILIFFFSFKPTHEAHGALNARSKMGDYGGTPAMGPPGGGQVQGAGPPNPQERLAQMRAAQAAREGAGAKQAVHFADQQAAAAEQQSFVASPHEDGLSSFSIAAASATPRPVALPIRFAPAIQKMVDDEESDLQEVVSHGARPSHATSDEQIDGFIVTPGQGGSSTAFTGGRAPDAEDRPLNAVADSIGFDILIM
jgi:hypothetical protein